MSSSPSEHRSAKQDLTLQPEQLETSFSQSLERHHAVFATLVALRPPAQLPPPVLCPCQHRASLPIRAA